MLFRASGWVIDGHVISQVLRLGTNLIMTRLLRQSLFGVMTIAHVFMVGLALFSDLGISQNVVQSRRGNDLAFLHTAWTVRILRGVDCAPVCQITRASSAPDSALSRRLVLVTP